MPPTTAPLTSIVGAIEALPQSLPVDVMEAAVVRPPQRASRTKRSEGKASLTADPTTTAAALAAARFGERLQAQKAAAQASANPRSARRASVVIGSDQRTGWASVATDRLVPLLELKPLLSLDDEAFDDFLYQTRMYPSRSRFPCGNLDWLAPRRDITVRAAMACLRERLQQAAAAGELVARLERDFLDEDPLPDDDEAVVVAANVRDLIRGALAMLGIVERALHQADPMVSVEHSPLPSLREPAMPYAAAAGMQGNGLAH